MGSLSEQQKLLGDCLLAVEVRGLSLAEGRRLAGELYATGQIYPELLQSYDEKLKLYFSKVK